jgi:excisionase family DNA binding protein
VSGVDQTMRARELRLVLPDEVLDELVERVTARVLEALEAPTQPEFLSVQEAAELLRAKPQRVYDLLSSRQLQGFKDGSRVLVRRADLVAHLLPRNGQSRMSRSVAR